jgi:archaellum component FlaC
MQPPVFLVALLSTVGIVAFTIIKVVRLIAHRPRSVPDDLAERVEELEQGLQNVQNDLAEAQERIDFAERLLAKQRGRESLAPPKE